MIKLNKNGNMYNESAKIKVKQRTIIAWNFFFGKLQK
jgi:hypothetical protein